MPALRVRSRTSRTCSSSIIVTTVPSLPARAVRPERCRYALCSTGGSAWITSATSSTWMPRAAMSVATSVLRAARVEVVHVACARTLAEVAVQLDGRNSRRVELLGELLRPVLRSREHDLATRGRGEVEDDGQPVRAVVDVEHVVAHRRHRHLAEVAAFWPADGLVGCCRGHLDVDIDLVEGAAEEESVSWRSMAFFRRTPGREPRLARPRPASSRTAVTSTLSRMTWPCCMRSSRRPGQATTTSTPARRPCTCGFWPTPPKIVCEVRPKALAERGHGGVDLRDELARRGENQGTRSACQAAPARYPATEAGQQGQEEGVRLAGAGATAAEHVAAGDRVRQGRRLDRGREGCDAEVVEDRDEVGGHAQADERLGNEAVRRQESSLSVGVSHPAAPPAVGAKAWASRVRRRGLRFGRAGAGSPRRDGAGC